MNHSLPNPPQPVICITRADPAAAAAQMAEATPNAHCVTATRLMWMIHDAVMDDTKDEFYRRFCTPPMLIVAVTEPDIMAKEALQFELTVILSVRRVNGLPTRFIFPADFDTNVLTNQSLRLFLSLADRGTPVRRLTEQSRFRRCLAQMAQMAAEDPLISEEDEEDEEVGEDDLPLSARILQNIEARIRELEQEVSRITEGEETDA